MGGKVARQVGDERGRFLRAVRLAEDNNATPSKGRSDGTTRFGAGYAGIGCRNLGYRQGEETAHGQRADAKRPNPCT